MREEPACGHLDAARIDEDLAAACGCALPDAHRDAAALARLAVGLRRQNQARFCSLPFCCTVEAEALGGAITLGDATAGPRALHPVCASLREILSLPRINFAEGRIAEVLHACALLDAQGEKVALEICGPITILAGLIDLTVLFRDWRRDECLMREVLGRLTDELCAYALAAAQAGVAALSYADPVGVMSILGAPRFECLADAHILPLLRQLEGGLDIPVHVCPKTAHALVATGRGFWRESAAPRRTGDICFKSRRAAAGATKELALA
ncbi:uroporphyrinogen-III decarboxylase [Rhodoblastus acidophilus]|uniref:uroporphyrinogen decarboxylase family protein n=1 Tax=Rhodoblastus acidophilus TaxID=1074 RepID=UPI0022245403|nr:uroporphyrinogen decarboxylase family protein [Rhodoblastus acidophilus]MCW2285436.1 uroporphyrinogen-III decarboxylase [Rhodoblastus acidophilus]MCW2334315.1 uroporphyrinogen-III decarboxylase [Rhodoblastus acidophilus]